MLSKKVADITGQEFGKLTVREFVQINSRKQSEWLCDCKCGRTRITEAYLLRRGTVNDCRVCAVEAGAPVISDYIRNWQKYRRDFTSIQEKRFQQIVAGRTKASILADAVDVVMREIEEGSLLDWYEYDAERMRASQERRVA